MTRKVTAAFKRGALDAYQDRCENVSFASTGGLDKRDEMAAPTYVPAIDRTDYLNGYIEQCRDMFGEDWQTCEFSWTPALVIGEPIAEARANS